MSFNVRYFVGMQGYVGVLIDSTDDIFEAIKLANIEIKKMGYEKTIQSNVEYV